MVAIAALGFAALGGANLTPPTATFTLTPGVGQTETNKVLNLSSPKTDIELAIDTTGSMTGGLADAVAEANAIVNGVQAEFPDTNFAVVQFKDAGFNPEYQVVQPMTPSPALIHTALSGLFAGGGGDPPEAYNLVFHNAYSAQAAIGFRGVTVARQILLVIGDAQPHGLLNTDGFTDCDDVGPDPDGLNTKTELTGLKNAGMTLLMIHEVDALDSTSLACYNDLVHFVNPNLDAVDSMGSGLAPTIVDLIGKANTYQSVALQVQSVSAGADPSWVGLPPALAPAGGIKAGNSYQFGPITFTAPVGTPPGTYTATLIAVADGSEILDGQETVTLNVLPTNGLQICKAADNGATGVTFNYTATNATTGASTPVAVQGGSCSAVLALSKGKYTVKETLAGGWSAKAIAVDPASALVAANNNPNIPNATVKVNVTTTGVTKVTYTNQKIVTALTVCKWSATTSLQGQQYSFTVANGATTIASPKVIAGKSAKNAGCSTPISVTAGSKLKITEAVPAQQAVAGITAAPSAILTSTNLAKGVANVKVLAGANQVTYENEPSGTNFLVCKRSSILTNGGPFKIDVTDTASPAHSYQFPLWVGNDKSTGGPTPDCNTVLVSGNVTVTEEPTPGYALQQITQTGSSFTAGPTIPGNGSQGGTATVPFDGSQNVEVDLYNNALSQPTGTIEICKTMLGTDPAPVNGVFSFNVEYADSAGNYQDAQPRDTKTLAPITQPIKVAAGFCSPPMIVLLSLANTVRITETDFPLGYVFNSATASAGANGPSRLVSTNASTSSVIVSVPPGSGVANETLVTVIDQLQRTFLKICKAIDPGSGTAIGNLNYSFTVTYNGATQTYPAGATTVKPPYPNGPNACTGLLGIPGTGLGFPVVNADGTLPTIVVQETPGAGFLVSSVNVQGYNLNTTPIPVLGSPGSITFTPAGSPDIVTFTNKAS